MLSELKLELKIVGEDDGFIPSSFFQGVLMESIDAAYAESLHVTGLHPYSICVSKTDEQFAWYIRTLSDEAYNGIILPLLSSDFR